MARSSTWRTTARKRMNPWLAARAINSVRARTSCIRALWISTRPDDTVVATADVLVAVVGVVVLVALGKRYRRAEFVMAESQARKERQSSHGPIVSVRWGSGRRK